SGLSSLKVIYYSAQLFRVRLGVFTSTSPTRTIDYENKNRCTHPRIIRINDDDVFRLGSRQNRRR
ncbi:hypothetical protein CUA47_12560, partial [Shigella dysenteriae]